MIIGVDFGNFNTKTSENVVFKSTICKDKKIIRLRRKDDERLVVFEGNKYLVGEGDLQTDINKLDKDMFRLCVLTAIAKSIEEKEVQVVIGVPNNQYNEKNVCKIKDELLRDQINTITVDGNEKTFILSKVEVYSEGHAPYYGMTKEQRAEIKSKDLIMVNIGGGNTNISYFKIDDGKRRLDHNSTISSGMIRLYSDFINAINGEFSLNKTIEDGSEILEHGLEIYGEKQDLRFTKEIIVEHTDRIFKELNLYPLKTSRVMFTGGGSRDLKGLLKKRLPGCLFETNYMMATAYGLKKVGEMLWQRK